MQDLKLAGITSNATCTTVLQFLTQREELLDVLFATAPLMPGAEVRARVEGIQYRSIGCLM